MSPFAVLCIHRREGKRNRKGGRTKSVSPKSIRERTLPSSWALWLALQVNLPSNLTIPLVLQSGTAIAQSFQPFRRDWGLQDCASHSSAGLSDKIPYSQGGKEVLLLSPRTRTRLGFCVQKRQGGTKERKSVTLDSHWSLWIEDFQRYLLIVTASFFVPYVNLV